MKLRSAVYRFGGKLQTSKLLLLCVNLFSKESLTQSQSSSQVSSSGQLHHKLNSGLTMTTTVPQDMTPGHDALGISRKFKPVSEEELEDPQKGQAQRSNGKSRTGISRLSKLLNFKSTILKVSNALVSLWLNPRLRTGMILLLIAAPVSRFFYLILPPEGFGEYFIQTDLITIVNSIEGQDWYYFSLYYWAFTLSELWAPMIVFLGIFFLFPKKYYPSYLVAVPFGYYAALLIHRLFATSNENFHNGVGFSTVALFIVFTIVMFVVSDKILFNDNHRKRAIEARIIGLINMPGMDWKDKEELLKKEAEQATKEKNNELFTRTG